MSSYLAASFKTLAGAQRRAAFENAHSKRTRFVIVRDEASGRFLLRRERKPSPQAEAREAARHAAYWREEMPRLWRLHRQNEGALMRCNARLWTDVYATVGVI